MPPENNQNFNQSMPQQPQKSGNLNTILLILLIALVGFGIWFLSQRKGEVVTESTNSDLLNYENEKLGVSFSYPKSYGDVTEKIEEWNGSFEYQLSLANGIRIIGKSNPYTPEGRGAWEIDLTEAEMSSVCDTEENQLIKTKNGIDGVFSFTRIAMYDSCDDIAGSGKSYYAVFDLEAKIQNMVIAASPDKVSKEDFIKFVNSIEIEGQNNGNIENCNFDYSKTEESKIISEQSATLLVGFEKKCDGYYYLTFDYLSPGEGNPEVGGSFYINTNSKLRTYRIQNGLSVALSNADVPSYSIDQYISSLRKLNTNIFNQDNAYIRNASSGQPVLNVSVENGVVVSIAETYLP